MTQRLSQAALARLPVSVWRPRYDRSGVTTGIVHLGIGAFHRAHQAVYVDDVLAGGDMRWGISGVSLRGGDTRAALAPQDGLYTLAVRSGEGTDLRVIGSIREVLVAPESIATVLARLCDPAVAIVSLTITEKGYCRGADGGLDLDHPAIRGDLANPAQPHSAVGLLAAAIARRRAAAVRPFTILSCDNLPSNGRVLSRLVQEYAAALKSGLAEFVRDEVASPATMVDRIVPATTDADRTEVADSLGFTDAWPVVTEPFCQWVVEDRFPSGRPDFGAFGAEMVTNVEPYEHMKLRLLNGSHSALAYLGLQAGLETVAEAIRTEALRSFTVALMNSGADTLSGIPPADIARYRASLLVRFANPALHHRLIQIAMDGSQKLPQRILAVVRDRLGRGLGIAPQALAVAAWITFASRGERLNDPMADETAAAAKQGPEGLLKLKTIFGELGDDQRFAPQVLRWCETIRARGTLAAAEEAALAA
ncbi:MAG TPA: mannitol dehydrogenase family protein [Bauldia sp.]|nr:mannitol dehydrogenase family protein [Bauldia sp.]